MCGKKFPPNKNTDGETWLLPYQAHKAFPLILTFKGNAACNVLYNIAGK
jgi:hypothetical protein